jgi:hypothetical protein
MSDSKDVTSSEPRRDSVESPVLYVSPASGGKLAANVIAGVIVCAIIGSCLGLAVNQLWIGAVFGVIVALSGFRFARRKDELPVLQIERGEKPGTMFVELRRGKSLTWSAADVSWVETQPEGDDDAAKTHWVVLHRVGSTPVRFRAKDGDQAAEVVIALREVLGLKEAPDAVTKGSPPDAAPRQDAPDAQS